jgi:Major Facilitator Superfamily
MSPATPHWRSQPVWLMIAQFAMQLSAAAWFALLANFAIEVIGTSGADYGLQQSIREIPGLLAFTVVVWLLVLREQNLALFALLLQGIGVAATGFFPTLWGFYLTTLIMSFGFHYYETMNQSLALQWLDKKTAPIWLGRVVAAGAFAQIFAYGAIIVTFKAGWTTYQGAFLAAGLITIAATLILAFVFPKYPETVPQTKKLFVRRRYWLYYALTFMQGARRQIFYVFAGFLLVQKFGYAVHEVAMLFLVNCSANMVIAPRLGAMIAKMGERWSITAENILLVIVFGGYALIVLDPQPAFAWVAAVLFVLDGVTVTLSIAIKTYFQKIGDPADMAAQAGVAFSINHIAAVVLPVLLGLIWLRNPALVFLCGCGFALISLFLARLIPVTPQAGAETIFQPRAAPAE